MKIRPLTALTASMFLLSFALILFELLLARLFAIVLFAQFAHLALALALLGISIGAIAQHLWPRLMPDEGLERRLALMSLLQGGLTLLAVLACLYFPIVEQWETPPENLGERSRIKDDLLNPFWFMALLPMLTAPFAAVGLSFAGTFHRRRKHIGQLYGADLIGGAVGAVVFIPALYVLAGPDLVFLIAGATALSALLLYTSTGQNTGKLVSTGVLGMCIAGVLVALAGDVLHVRYAAGYSEENVTYSRWTPLARLSVHETDKRTGAMILLDNTSASDVLMTEKDVKWASGANHRSLVYKLYEPGARVAVLAASAGPDVAVAQYHGHTDVTAIDIAGDIFDIVAERYPDAPKNPYTQPGVTRVHSDGRAAILHASEPFDIIHMVHANLWSSAGLLSNAWSPALLETAEAFDTYLDKLTDRGTISFAKGNATNAVARAASEALLRRGVEEPWRHMLYMRAPSTLLLVKKQPWKKKDLLATYDLIDREYRGDPEYLIKPLGPLGPWGQRLLFEGPVMTDDRPYLDGPDILKAELKRAWKNPKDRTPLAQLYRSVVIQCLFVFIAGLAFIGLPLIRRGPTQLKDLRGVGVGLVYVSCLGYGYLAVETILIHELILFVGHPTYAITVVILTMLLFSGLGSIASERIDQGKLMKVLYGVLATVIGLGALQAFVVPDLLHSFALGWPLPVRIGLTFLVLAPLGFVMGMPFPIAMRMLDDRAGGLVPWAWALNGWMSVVASLATVLISRMFGYSWAFSVALAAYGLALIMAGGIPKIAPKAASPAE